jgi:hypothetical protein
LLLQHRDKVLALDEVMHEKIVIQDRPRKRKEMEHLFDRNADVPRWLTTIIPDLDAEFQKLFTQLDDHRKRKTPALVTDNFCLSGTTWEYKTSKNPNRDFKPLAQAAIVESALVQNYRREVLEECAPAHELRNIIQKFLSDRSKPKAIIKKQARKGLTTAAVKEWKFADGIDSVEQKITMSWVMADMIEGVEDRRKRAADRKALAAAIAKIESLPFLAVEPESELLAPKIHALLEKLVRHASINWAVHNNFKKKLGISRDQDDGTKVKDPFIIDLEEVDYFNIAMKSASKKKIREVQKKV